MFCSSLYTRASALLPPWGYPCCNNFFFFFLPSCSRAAGHTSRAGAIAPPPLSPLDRNLFLEGLIQIIKTRDFISLSGQIEAQRDSRIGLGGRESIEASPRFTRVSTHPRGLQLSSDVGGRLRALMTPSARQPSSRKHIS